MLKFKIKVSAKKKEVFPHVEELEELPRVLDSLPTRQLQFNRRDGTKRARREESAASYLPMGAWALHSCGRRVTPMGAPGAGKRKITNAKEEWELSQACIFF